VLGQVSGEIPGVPPASDLHHTGRELRDGPVQQLPGDRPGILVGSHQVRGQRHGAVGPERDVRPVGALTLIVVHGVLFLAAVDLHVGGVPVDRGRRQQLGPRRAGSNLKTRALIAPIPFSIPARCAGVKRFANCAVVVDAGVGTGSNSCPAVSARRRSIPTRKSSPASCAHANDNTRPPAESPRSRCLTEPTAQSRASAMPNTRSASVTAATPA